jgi:glucosyltransferase
VKKEKISIIVSCYNEEESIPLFYEEINKVAQKMNYADFEFIFINDGSKDKTIDILRNYAKKDSRIRYVSFSRNFGKEAAMFAGMECARGDYITFMDADLQDPPSLLPKMYKLIKEENYDCIGTRRVSRKGEPVIRSFFARRFYRLINKISKIEMVDGARDYRFMTKQMADSIGALREYNRYSKGIFSFVGFNTKWIEYENIERVKGETKWSFWRLFIYALDGITDFSTVPLAISAFIGLLFCIISFIVILFVIGRTVINGDPVAGWPSLVCIIFMVSGIQLFCVGIIGQYLSKTYLETKRRPIYIIKETENSNT